MKNNQKSIKKWLKNQHQIHTWFLSLWKSILGPFWEPLGTFGSPWATKMGQKGVTLIEQEHFFLRAITKIVQKWKKLNFGLLGGPFWDPPGPIWGAQDPPRGSQGTPKWSRMAPTSSPRGLSVSTILFINFSVVCWSNFGPKLHVFW